MSVNVLSLMRGIFSPSPHNPPGECPIHPIRNLESGGSKEAFRGMDSGASVTRSDHLTRWEILRRDKQMMRKHGRIVWFSIAYLRSPKNIDLPRHENQTLPLPPPNNQVFMFLLKCDHYNDVKKKPVNLIQALLSRHCYT